MAILLDENSQVICQGVTRSQGVFHSDDLADAAAKIVKAVKG